MSRRLRHNLSDPAIRSARAEAVHGAIAPNGSAPSSNNGGSARDSPDSPGPSVSRSTSSTVGRVRHNREESGPPTWRAAGSDHSLLHDSRRRGARPLLFVPTVNAKPIPLRGGGRGAVTQETTDAQRDMNLCDLTVTSNGMQRTPILKSSSRGSLRTSTPQRQHPTVCSISTPVDSTLGTPRSFDKRHPDFQLQLQETRDRLASLESEQRKLIDTSLGALVKAACAMSSPSRGVQKDKLLPNASTFACRSPTSEASDHCSLPGDTVMVPTMTTACTTCALPHGCDNVEPGNLEDENRRLREAIALMNFKNNELAASCQAAEARSRLLQEENQAAVHRLGVALGTSDRTSQFPLHSSEAEIVATAQEGARRDLIHLSTDAERKLEDLFTRRANLQAIMKGREFEPEGRCSGL